jgi:hypothetical protein
MLCLHAMVFARLRDRIASGYPDFTVFYTAGTAVRDGLGPQLYDEHTQYQIQEKAVGHIASRHAPLPYIHPSYEALIFVPLTLLPYVWAFALWNLLNAMMLAAVLFLLRRSVAWLRSIPIWEFLAASLAFFPIFACFLEGQDSILLLLLCTLAFSALERKADFLAGCWLGLGVFKFQLVVPIIVLFAIWKRRRMVAGFAVVGMLLILLSAALTGWHGLLRYTTYVMKITNTPGLGGIPAELLPNLHGLILGWRLPLSQEIGHIVVIGVSLALLAWAGLRGAWSRQPETIQLHASLAILTAVLIGWQTNAHDLSLLLLPLVFSVQYCLEMPEPSRRFSLLTPVAPLLISPLWIVLWLYFGKVNLIALPLLWWAWRISRELPAETASKPPGVSLARGRP